jgi:hypothetical protein
MQTDTAGIGKRKKRMLAVIIALVGLIACYPFILNIVKNAIALHLSVYKPIPDAGVLVVEGWLFDNLIPNVKKEFENGRYAYILISWQPKGDEPGGRRLAATENGREHMTRRLMALGLDSSKIKVVEVHPEATHNTLAMALAVKKWFYENDPAVTRVNVCTVGAHGRKTWVAYKRALGKDFTVGILSLRKRKIPVSLWWKESDGGLRWLLLRWVGAIYVVWWPLSWVDTR